MTEEDIELVPLGCGHMGRRDMVHAHVDGRVVDMAIGEFGAIRLRNGDSVYTASTVYLSWDEVKSE